MRGFWYMIEAVLAGIILIGFLLSVSVTYADVPESDISLRGYSILHELDQQGILKGYVAEGDCPGLDSQITLLGYDHSIQICGQSGECIGSRPDADNIWIGNYLVAGDDAYEPNLVKLYIWRAGA